MALREPLETPDAAGPFGRRNLADVLAACSRDELLRYVHTLERRALHDPLTGLANRALLQDRLQQAVAFSRRYDSPFALLVCDLDGFKEVNDRHGHEVGDRVLCAASERLLGALRSSDSVARLGGDEFAVLLPDTDRAGAQVVSDKITAAMKEPIRLDSLSIHVGVSVGVSMFPEDAADVAALVRRADRHMYGVKGRRRAPRRFVRGFALGAVMWILAAVVGAVYLDSIGDAGVLPDLAAPPGSSQLTEEPSGPLGPKPLRILGVGRSLGLGADAEDISLVRSRGPNDTDDGDSSGSSSVRRSGGGGGNNGDGGTGGGGDNSTGSDGGSTGGDTVDSGTSTGSDDSGSSDDGPGNGRGHDRDDDPDDGGHGQGKGKDRD